MTAGDRVYVSDAAGAASGRVLSTATLDELPDIAGAPAADEVRALLKAGGAVRVIGIQIGTEEEGYMFCAIETEAGNFYDLEGEQLSILHLATA